LERGGSSAVDRGRAGLLITNVHEDNLWNANVLQSECSIPYNSPAYVTAETYIEMSRNGCNVSSNKISHLVHLFQNSINYCS